MTKKPDKKEHKEGQQQERPNEDCAQCEARRRSEIALLNAELIIQEAEERDSC